MRVVSSHQPPGRSVGEPKLDWEVVAQLQRRARRLRAEAFTRAFRAPWIWLKSRLERAYAPWDFASDGTCP